jgi:hypothetical protein
MTLGQWAQDWKATKVDFKTVSGKDKPDAKKLDLVMVQVSSHKASVNSALKNVDASYDAYRSALTDFNRPKPKIDQRGLDKCYNQFGRDIEQFEKAAAAYGPAIEAAINKNFSDNKNIKTDYYRACKVLEKSLDSIGKEIALQSKQLSDIYRQVDTKESKKQQLFKSLTSNIAKARVFTARCKALGAKPGSFDEAVDVFNKGVQTASRDVTQALGVAKKLCNIDPPQGPNKYLIDRNGGDYKLPEDIKVQKYRDEIKEFDQNLKALGDWVDTNIPR